MKHFVSTMLVVLGLMTSWGAGRSVETDLSASSKDRITDVDHQVDIDAVEEGTGNRTTILETADVNLDSADVKADELVVLMLRDIQSQINELNVKTETLQTATDDLQVAVGGLILNARNVEDDLTNQQQQITGKYWTIF